MSETEMEDRMRNGLLVLWTLLLTAMPTMAQVSIGIGLPNVNIGFNLRTYPTLLPVPGYPVYYAPGVNSNYFFYDGMYWVYQGDRWYASSWYNGPWALVSEDTVPVFVLRVPVGYYRMPPPYFRGWQSNAAPRWGEHWGNDWAQRRSGWDQWNHSKAPAPAPLPSYQRKYSGERYPAAEQQQALHNQKYRYQPHDPEVRQQLQAPRAQSAPPSAQRGAQGSPQGRGDPRESERGQGPGQERDRGKADDRGGDDHRR
jgi:hypothetical protein